MRTLQIEAVVAAERNEWGIGSQNELPWRLPKDMKRFREITKDSAVIMGTKTALSIGKALPKRTNFVLTHQGHAPYENQIPVSSVQEAVNHYLAITDKKHAQLFVLGGEEIYHHTLPFLTGIHLTLVYGAGKKPDRFFPMNELALMHGFDHVAAIANHPEGAVDDGEDVVIPTHYVHSTWKPLMGPPVLSMPDGWRLGKFQSIDLDRQVGDGGRAYEGHSKTMTNPRAYVDQSRPNHPLDELIEDEKYHPIKDNSHE
jgi:dihydrofolate reductase